MSRTGMNRTGIVLGLTLALAALVAPTSASAASGWVLPQAVGIHGNRVDTSFGRRCGTSKFGIWSMVGTSTRDGVQSRWTFKLEITADGALHHVRSVQFSTYTSAKDRRLVRSIFAQTQYRYQASNGSEFLQGVGAGGEQQSLQRFNPAPGNCR